MNNYEALGRITKRFGPVQVTYVHENDPHFWTVALVSTHDGTACWNHTHGERLEETLEALWEQLNESGVLPYSEALKLGSPSQ